MKKILTSFIFLLLFFISEQQVYAQLSIGQPRKAADGKYVFYHWGKQPWMDEMIRESIYTPERHKFFMSRHGANGVGIYFADTPYGSYSYVGGGSGGLGNGEGGLV